MQEAKDEVNEVIKAFKDFFGNIVKPILLVSERLGHESVQTTLNTDTHLYPDNGIKLADELQKIGKIEPQ